MNTEQEAGGDVCDSGVVDICGNYIYNNYNNYFIVYKCYWNKV